MTFICKRCNQCFLYKAYLKSHLERKRRCEFIENDIDVKLLLEELYKRNLNEKTYDCDFCGMKFNSTSGKCQHKKICKNKPISSDEKVNELTKVVEDLKNKLEKLNGKNSLTTNNNITNNTQNNINVTIPKLNDFGKENMNALPETLISTLFMDLRFRELLSNLHCDPNYPENQNIRIKSIKRNTMEIFRNNKWDIMTFTNGLTELLLQGHKIFKDYYKKDKNRILEEDMSEDEIKEILNQLDQIEKLNKEELGPLMIDLQMMLEEYKNNGSAISIL
jgi:hypothetical protein